MAFLDIEYVGPGVAATSWNRLASPPDPWTTITFDRDNYDPGHHHAVRPREVIRCE